MYKLELKNITKKLGNKIVLDNIDIKIKQGERIGILGPSGCGKSTLLNIISGILKADNGKIFLSGEDITDTPINKRNIVIVSQENLLFPHMNVFENIGFSLTVRKYSKENIKEKVKKLLDEIGLSGYENKRVDQLSGGEKQRVALARALASEPEILLLDEAYSSLDTIMREKMRELTIQIHENHKITSILVTHDKEEAMIFSDRLAIILDGKIMKLDIPDKIYEKPQNLKSAEFLMRDNYVKIENIGTIFIKPEDIKITKIKELKEEDIAKTIEKCLDIKENRCKTIDKYLNMNESMDRKNCFNKNLLIESDGITIYGKIIKKLFLGIKIQYLINCGDYILKVDDFEKRDGYKEYLIGENVELKAVNYCIYDMDGEIIT